MGFYGSMEAPSTEDQRAEIPFINTLCELVRRGQMELFQIPTLEDEKRRRPDRHSDLLGCANIDHGVKVKDLRFECPRMKFSLGTSRQSLFSPAEQDCSINLGKHHLLFEHFAGRGQFRDAWHLMLCDSFGIEIFFTCDEKFLRRYAQVRGRLNSGGLRTRVMRPSEFCRELGIPGIPIAPTDPYGMMRGTIR